LLVFIRGIDANFQLTEEILSVESLKNTTPGKDLFSAVENCIARTGLAWNKIARVTTDGAMPSYHFTASSTKKVCEGALNIKQVTDSIVNAFSLIRARGLNHRQFQALLEDLETEQLNVHYHSRARWLSLGKVLRRVW